MLIKLYSIQKPIYLCNSIKNYQFNANSANIRSIFLCKYSFNLFANIHSIFLQIFIQSFCKYSFNLFVQIFIQSFCKYSFNSPLERGRYLKARLCFFGVKNETESQVACVLIIFIWLMNMNGCTKLFRWRFVTKFIARSRKGRRDQFTNLLP